MQITDKIKQQFSSWVEPFREFIESEEFGKIYAFLKEQSSKGRKVIPAASDVFKSLELCDYNKVKAVIVLQDPYPTMRDDKMIADGIPMNCQNTGIAQPSLLMWNKAIEESELGPFDQGMNMDHRNDLSYLLIEEHVLLINSSLTVEYQKVGSHAQVWQPFMNYLFKILNERKRGLPIVLCGLQAQKYEKEINPLLHYIIKVEHMAAAAHSNREWEYNDMFSKVNKIIESNNGAAERVRWYRLMGEETVECPF